MKTLRTHIIEMARRPRFLLLVMVVFCVSSCAGAYYGGSTMGTGITPYEGGSTHGSANVQYLTVYGRVVGSGRKPQSGVTVEAKTARTTESAVSAADGTFSVLVVRSDNEPVTFKVRSGKRAASYEHTGYLADGDRMTFEFIGNSVRVR